MCTPKAAARLDAGASEGLDGSACSMLGAVLSGIGLICTCAVCGLRPRNTMVIGLSHGLEKSHGLENAAGKRQL
jgi:hypothetical protein